MFNSARQEGSTAACVIAFWGFGLCLAWLVGDLFGVVANEDLDTKESTVLLGLVTWLIALIANIAATVGCVFGLAGFAGIPYASLLPSE